MTFISKCKEEYGKNPFFVIFCGMLICGFAASLLLSVVTRGWFFRWAFDVDPILPMFSDHYDSMMYSIDHPYSGYHIIYPVLINGVYVILSWLAMPYLSDIGDNLSQQFANTQMAVYGYVIFVLVSLIVLNYLVHRFLDKPLGGTKASMVACCLLMAAPLLYAISRGNCIVYSILFMFGFLVFYQSENTKVRYISYVCLAISSGIKIFPALLVLLILREKRYAEFFWCLLIIVFVQVVPFVFFDGTILDLLNNMISHSSRSSVNENGISIISWTILITHTLFGYTSSIPGLIIVSALLLLSFVLIMKDKEMPYWQVVALLCCSLTIGFVNPTGYVYLNMLPALLLFLGTQREVTRKTLTYAVLFALMFMTGVMPVQVRSIVVAILMISLLVDSVRRVRTNNTSPVIE